MMFAQEGVGGKPHPHHRDAWSHAEPLLCCEGSGMSDAKVPGSYSILITDDEVTVREALREIVEPQGFRTILAASGEEALEIVQSETVHLALLDMHMPRLTGLETIQLVRQINALLPVILITADTSSELKRQAFFARVYSVIPKPVTKNIVLYTVLRALDRSYKTTEPSSSET